MIMTEEQERYLDDSYDRRRDDKLTEEAETVSIWYENLSDHEQKNIRDDYEDMLLEQWYSKHTVSETSDWRDEFIREYYKNI